MSEPRVVPYWTTYGGRKQRVMASDAYNAATNRARKQFGGRWRFWTIVRIAGRELFVVRRGNFQRRIAVGL